MFGLTGSKPNRDDDPMIRSDVGLLHGAWSQPVAEQIDDVEVAAISWLTTTLLLRNLHVAAYVRDTAANLLLRNPFEKCGRTRRKGDRLTDRAGASPARVRLNLSSPA